MANETQPATEVKQSNTVARFFKKLLVWLIFILIISGTATYFVFTYTYSEGNRAGLLLKFSHKGYIFKTYEGELNQGGINPMPGNTIANNIWEFSVKDKIVAQHLLELQGKMVKLHYKEQIRNLPWQGDTKYFVDDVTEIK